MVPASVGGIPVPSRTARRAVAGGEPVGAGFVGVERDRIRAVGSGHRVGLKVAVRWIWTRNVTGGFFIRRIRGHDPVVNPVPICITGSPVAVVQVGPDLGFGCVQCAGGETDGDGNGFLCHLINIKFRRCVIGVQCARGSCRDRHGKRCGCDIERCRRRLRGRLGRGLGVGSVDEGWRGPVVERGCHVIFEEGARICRHGDRCFPKLITSRVRVKRQRGRLPGSPIDAVIKSSARLIASVAFINSLVKCDALGGRRAEWIAHGRRDSCFGVRRDVPDIGQLGERGTGEREDKKNRKKRSVQWPAGFSGSGVGRESAHGREMINR